MKYPGLQCSPVSRSGARSDTRAGEHPLGGVLGRAYPHPPPPIRGGGRGAGCYPQNFSLLVSLTYEYLSQGCDILDIWCAAAVGGGEVSSLPSVS